MIGGDVDFHFPVAEYDDARARGKNGRGPGSQFGKEARVLIGAEARQARDHTADMALARERLHEQPIRLVAAAVRRIVQRVLGQQDLHRVGLQ